MHTVKEIQVTISGTVQMVFFRSFAREWAERLSLTGFAENHSDGSVRVVAQGSEASLYTFIKKLHEGPPAASVTNVEVLWREPVQKFDAFSVH